MAANEPRAFLAWCYEVSPGEIALLTHAEVDRRGLRGNPESVAPSDFERYNASCHVRALKENEELRAKVAQLEALADIEDAWLPWSP